MSITFASQAWDGTRLTWTHQGPELNVHNAGALDLFRILGYLADGTEPGTFLGCPIPPEEVAGGDADPGDFLGRVLIALGLLGITTDDEHGRLPLEDGISGGRRPGYLAERLVQLEEIARDAIAYQARVVWG